MEALKQLEALIAAKISAIKTVSSLIRLEARLAGLSVFPLLLNIGLLLVVLLTVWLSVMFLIGYLAYLVSGYFVHLVSNRLLLSISFVLLLNVGFLLGLLKYLSFNIKSMSFQKTRAFFSQESEEHEKIEKADNRTN
ncbi:hypothetical protein LEAN103870_18060 [Legionella anisa]|uniref:Phage holin family protein n=1 Tax=Legionella anisa TaxID=28082 RepID=A0AAX0WRR8_9GAMM|nr:hypothetical protein [Legionella anisa]AWN75028.1 hypothetical protein DLD14_14925 [Legionella anisa]KTC67371.1 hypothetical protein Lani_3716 [Legionella anisa]MBN5933960.1 hypothetical protein [Legionella anisa]MCW8424768.1 hypothetical protein [Legionella anisa]MCW8446113.1 hypothetical protein [Legionella anisa]